MPPDSSHRDTEYTETPFDVVLSHHMIKASWVFQGKVRALTKVLIQCDSHWSVLSSNISK